MLAAVIVPLALFTIYRGWTERIEKHRQIARWTLPLWLYVSVSGVAVYLMLYFYEFRIAKTHSTLSRNPPVSEASACACRPALGC